MDKDSELICYIIFSIIECMRFIDVGNFGCNSVIVCVVIYSEDKWYYECYC